MYKKTKNIFLFLFLFCNFSFSQNLQINIFSSVDYVCSGDSIMLELEITGGILPYNVLWESSEFLSNDTILTPFAFPDYSMYFVVTVSDFNNDTISDSIYIEVKQLPDVFYTFDNSCEFDSINFINQSLNSSSCLWNFGNNYTSGEENPVFVFVNYGFFDIKLIAFSEFGCKDSLSQIIEIFPKPIGYPFSSPEICDEVIFIDTSAIPSGEIVERNWIINQQIITTSGNSIFYNFPQSNINYEVSVILISDNNCKDTVYQNIMIWAKPNADFDVNEVCKNDSNLFINTSTIENGNIYYSNWYFENSLFAENYQKDSIYYLKNDAGIYESKLIVFSDKFCTDTINKTAVVNPIPAPEILGETFLCSNSSDNKYSFIDDDNSFFSWNYDYIADIQYISQKQDTLIVHWKNDSISSTLLQLSETISETGCKDSVNLQIFFSSSKSPDKCEIVFKADKPENNILVSMDFTVNTWQWGFNEEVHNSDSARWHFWQIPHKFNIENNYWVETSYGQFLSDNNLCKTRSYLDNNLYKNGLSDEYFNLFPNPFIDNIYFELKNNYFGWIKLEIYDYSGNLLNCQKIMKSEEYLTNSLNLSELNFGYYILKIYFGKNFNSLIIFKSK